MKKTLIFSFNGPVTFTTVTSLMRHKHYFILVSVGCNTSDLYYSWPHKTIFLCISYNTVKLCISNFVSLLKVTYEENTIQMLHFDVCFILGCLFNSYAVASMYFWTIFIQNKDKLNVIISIILVVVVTDEHISSVVGNSLLISLRCVLLMKMRILLPKHQHRDVCAHVHRCVSELHRPSISHYHYSQLFNNKQYRSQFTVLALSLTLIR